MAIAHVLQRDEEIAGFERAGIDRNAVDAPRFAVDEAPAGCSLRFFS